MMKWLTVRRKEIFRLRSKHLFHLSDETIRFMHRIGKGCKSPDQLSKAHTHAVSSHGKTKSKKAFVPYSQEDYARCNSIMAEKQAANGSQSRIIVMAQVRLHQRTHSDMGPRSLSRPSDLSPQVCIYIIMLSGNSCSQLSFAICHGTLRKRSSRKPKRRKGKGDSRSVA